MAKQTAAKKTEPELPRPSREQIRALVDMSMERAQVLIDEAIAAGVSLPWAESTGLAQAIRDAARAWLGLRAIDPILVTHLPAFHQAFAGATIVRVGEDVRIALPDRAEPAEQAALPLEQAARPLGEPVPDEPPAIDAEVLPPGDPSGGMPEAQPAAEVPQAPAAPSQVAVVPPGRVEPAKAMVRIDRGLAPQSMDELYRMSVAVFRSGLAPRSLKTAEAVFTAVATGLELGLRPMAALRAIYVVNGMPALKGEAAVAVIRSSGKCRYWRPSVEGEGDARCGIIRSMRTDNPDPLETRFSVAQAKHAKLWGKTSNDGKPSPWVTFPDRMLVWRAIGHHAADYYSDVTLGTPLVEVAQDLPASIEPGSRGEPPAGADPLLES